MISVIVAVSQNGVIGCDNKLIWHISEDLRRFKALTTGHAVVMGRKTYESIGRPLPNRLNLIFTRNRDYEVPENCQVIHRHTLRSLSRLVAEAERPDEIFVIGGAELYAQAMPVADKLYMTVVHADYEGDTLFPEWDERDWMQVLDEHFPQGKEFDKPFTFREFIRIRK